MKRPIELIRNSDAYIPFSVIGIFVILGAVFASAYFLQADYEIAKTIYTTDRVDPEVSAIGFASADLSRCLNYAGIEALKWKGEHPIIQPLSSSASSTSTDDFIVTASTHDLEAGDTLKITIDLPSDAWYGISSIWKDQSIILRVKDSNGDNVAEFDHGEAVSVWRTVSFEENVMLPKEMPAGYGSIELSCGGNIKATDWFSISMNPVKDIAANRFNELITGNYQNENYVYDKYAINIEPDIKSHQIIIEGINGTLDRQINHDNSTYTIYYTFSIKDLNYTFVDLESGDSFERTMDISTLVNSREPLLEELTKEYERSLNSAETSNIVLGTMNIRSFIYGPWQHYANGPLNIITNPSLASAVNIGTTYSQKRTFDSVDPAALLFTSYYGGKVFYEDIHGTASSYGLNGSSNMTEIARDITGSGSFSIDMNDMISSSMQDTGSSLENVEQQSEITVAAVDYIPSTVDGWVFEDHAWQGKENDLIHNVAHEIYSADVQAQVIRDGFNETVPIFTNTIVDDISSSYSYHNVRWSASTDIQGEHVGALYPAYSWNDSWTNSYDHAYNFKTNKTLSSWKITGATVTLNSAVTDVSIKPTFHHTGNDSTTKLYRLDEYLEREDHVFDWDIRYEIEYTVKTTWKVDYNIFYKFIRKKWTGSGWDKQTISSSATRTEYVTTTQTRSYSHSETETENLSIIYHKRPTARIYSGIENYNEPIIREYRSTTFEINGTQFTDPACSDAADKYADQYVDIYEIESRYNLFPNNYYLPQHTIECDIPEWLHKMMGEEVIAMFEAVEDDDPNVKISLMDNLGADPTMLRYEAAKNLVDDMEDDTEKYVHKADHLTNGDLLTSSNAARYITKNEAYSKLINEIESQNQQLNDDLNGYLLKKLKDVGANIPGLDGDALSGVTSGSLSLFNNPTISMAGNALATDMGVIDTINVTGMPESKYSWNEGLTLEIDQYPDYLYHDPDFDVNIGYEMVDPKGATIYPLGVKNTCVFSTGIAEDIAGLLENAGSPAKEATSQMLSKSIEDLNSEVNMLEHDLSEQALALDTTTLDSHVTSLTRTYSRDMKNRIPEKIAEQVSDDPIVSQWIDSATVTVIANNYLDTLSNREIINMSADGTLSLKITESLRTKVRADNPHLTGDEMEAVLNRLDTDVRMGIAQGTSAVIVDNSAMIDASFSSVNDELQRLTDDAYSQMNKEAADKVEKRLERTMSKVPMGLPVLPPNWVFTTNVWTYDVVGKYEYFKVTDGDNKAILDYGEGHVGQVYVREEEPVFHPFKRNQDNQFIQIGINMPIRFEMNGYATTIVGPRPKGVGDKIGGRTETSIAYDILKSEMENEL